MTKPHYHIPIMISCIIFGMDEEIHLFHTGFIRTSLDLKDKTIFFDENIYEGTIIKGFRSKVLRASLTYKPTHCECFKMKNLS